VNARPSVMGAGRSRYWGSYLRRAAGCCAGRAGLVGRCAARAGLVGRCAAPAVRSGARAWRGSGDGGLRPSPGACGRGCLISAPDRPSDSAPRSGPRPRLGVRTVMTRAFQSRGGPYRPVRVRRRCGGGCSGRRCGGRLVTSPGRRARISCSFLAGLHSHPLHATHPAVTPSTVSKAGWDQEDAHGPGGPGTAAGHASPHRARTTGQPGLRQGTGD
jgi:hypothetical protein